MRAFFTVLFTVFPFAFIRAAPAACPPEVNSATITFIKGAEGFVGAPGPDPIGLPTVGFGHLCKIKSCPEAGNFPLSKAEASTLLNSDLGQFTSCLNKAIKPNVKLNDNQFGALASFTFNEGCRNMESSTLIKRLNAGEDPNTVAGEELLKFKFAGGKVLDGLVTRRVGEVKLFKTPSNIPTLPC